MGGILSRALAALLLLCATTACASFRFEKQLVLMQHDAEADTLEVGIVYVGLLAKDEEAQKAIERVAAGDRYFILYDWFLEVDVDEAATWTPEELVEDDFPDLAYAERLAAFLDGIEVRSHGYFRDERGGVGAYQSFRIPHAQEGLKLLNEAINYVFIDEARPGDEATGKDLEERLLIAGLDAARRKLSMVTLAPEWLEIRVAASPALAADLLELLVPGVLPAEAEGDLLALWHRLAKDLDELRVDDESIRLRFFPDVSGRYELRLEREEWADSQTRFDPRGTEELERLAPELDRKDMEERLFGE